jgi:Carboxypeptidase regulatory-like domain
MTRTLRILMFVGGLVFLLSPLYAQKQTGDIKGTVMDAKGAVVAGATVTARNQATNAERSATTTGEGDYAITDLSPGLYEVKVSSQGFKETVARNIDLHVASTSTANLKLEVGAASETITVEANAIQVETTSASVGEVVNGQQVRELPLNSSPNCSPVSPRRTISTARRRAWKRASISRSTATRRRTTCSSSTAPTTTTSVPTARSLCTRRSTRSPSSRCCGTHMDRSLARPPARSSRS